MTFSLFTRFQQCGRGWGFTLRSGKKEELPASVLARRISCANEVIRPAFSYKKEMVSIDLTQAVNGNTDLQIWSEGSFYSIVSSLSTSFGQGSFCLTQSEHNDINSQVMSYLHSSSKPLE